MENWSDEMMNDGNWVQAACDWNPSKQIMEIWSKTRMEVLPNIMMEILPGWNKEWWKYKQLVLEIQAYELWKSGQMK